MTTDKILDKLAKLKAARDGEARIGNSAAAEAFASMINRLLLEHELSEVDIPLNVDADPVVEKFVSPREHGFKFSRTRVGWQERLADIVARAHLCEYLVHSGSNYITLIGTKSHTAVAEFAYVTLVRAAAEMSKRARDDYWREHRDDPDFESGNFRAAWLRGFIGRIAERFNEARRVEVAATGNTSTALVRLNQQLVRAKQYVDAMKGVRKVGSTKPPSGCIEGQIAGRAAADKMAIGRRGVGATTERKAIR